MTTAPTLDVGPVRVSGAIRANRARVFYLGGRLYVVAAANNVKAIDTDEPIKDGEVWKTHTADGHHIEFTRKGCPSCGWSLGRLKLDRLIDVANGTRRQATDHI